LSFSFYLHDFAVRTSLRANEAILISTGEGLLRSDKSELAMTGIIFLLESLNPRLLESSYFVILGGLSLLCVKATSSNIKG